MLQLVQSPSERVQRLIREQCTGKPKRDYNTRGDDVIETKNRSDEKKSGGGGSTVKSASKLDENQEKMKGGKSSRQGDPDETDEDLVDQATSATQPREVSSIATSDSRSPRSRIVNKIIKDQDGNVLAASSSYSSSSSQQNDDDDGDDDDDFQDGSQPSEDSNETE